ncbi:MAG: shikimate dehydrogenase [Mariprofundaceae bacterium]|nr:shikimate dehydrogenase [Mariprofundaceae bacterium]
MRDTVITGETKVYGIIGCPVRHSLSPVFQAYFARKHGLDVVYTPYHVEEGQLKQAVRGLASLGVLGVNVTVPYKEAMLPYVHADDDVQCIGAANTLKWDGSVWLASNTDWQGINTVFAGTGLILKGEHLLLFGAGGTARAVLHAASKHGLSRVAICNRSPERVKLLIEHAQRYYPGMHCYALAWQQAAVTAACHTSSMVLNTTSIGLSAADVFPFQIYGQGWLLDAVYKPSGETAFLHAAALSDRSMTDGLAMLVAQGAKSFRDWHPECRPDTLDALAWMEAQLERQPIVFPGWEGGR